MAAVTTLASNAFGFMTAPGTGMSHEVHKGREATGQTWAKGAVLIVSSGQIAEASNQPTSAIIGIAAAKATGTVNSEVLYYPATVAQVFEATLENQATAGHTLAITDLWTKYGLYKDTNGIWYINFNDTTNKAVTVIGTRLDSDIDNATVRARVLCRFISSACEFHS